MTCRALCVVRVQRGLRGAAVMCSLVTTRLLRARCRGMQRGGVGGARGLAVQAARRQSRLHRWGMQWLHTRRRGSELHRSFAACSKGPAVALYTRARRVGIARRGDRTC